MTIEKEVLRLPEPTIPDVSPQARFIRWRVPLTGGGAYVGEKVLDAGASIRADFAFFDGHPHAEGGITVEVFDLSRAGETTIQADLSPTQRATWDARNRR